MSEEQQTHLFRPGCEIDYMAHTRCGRTVKTLRIANGRPTCEDCYSIYFRELMAMHQAAIASGVVRAPR
ncbi:MAG TPA: hypothetical protein VHC90_11415 [Bryobacteraceae bacterium]|nr:hypothetical protein [Bryobacteraceae bacterium]